MEKLYYQGLALGCLCLRYISSYLIIVEKYYLHLLSSCTSSRLKFSSAKKHVPLQRIMFLLKETCSSSKNYVRPQINMFLFKETCSSSKKHVPPQRKMLLLKETCSSAKNHVLPQRNMFLPKEARLSQLFEFLRLLDIESL